jgi:L-iditol 2-dehydrogenase
MKAALLIEPKKIEMNDLEIPKIREDEVLIKIKRVGICGSDNHIYNKGEIAFLKVKLPFILGHECSGEVVDIGKGVNNIKIGNRVAIEPSIHCGKCEFCRKGKFNLCDDYRFLAAPPDNNGALVEYLAHRSDHCFLIPDSISYEEGALIEPLAIVVQAFEISNFNIGDPILILGAGTIGLLTLMLLKSLGADKCVIVDYYDEKLSIAKKMGADFTVNVKDEDLLSKIRKFSDNKGFPVIFDSAGKENSLNIAITVAKKGGTIVIIGISEEKASFNIVDLIGGVLTIKGTNDFGDNIFNKAISLVKDKKVDVKKIISHSFNFDEIDEAFKNVNNNSNNTIKTIININE